MFERLAAFCHAPGGIHHDCMLSFRLAQGVEIPGIHLTCSEQGGGMTIELWATTSQSGKACLRSNDLLERLHKTLLECHGYELRLDPSDGKIQTLFVHREHPAG